MQLDPLRVYHNDSIYLTYVNDSIHFTYVIFHSQGLVFHGHCLKMDTVHYMSSLILLLIDTTAFENVVYCKFKGGL